ncbi:MAG: hypothetical protein ACKVYV_00060 [Limisphaerales bacterium]
MIVRLLADGRPDPSWHVFTTLGYPNSLVRDAAGRTLVAVGPGVGHHDPDPAAFASVAASVVRLLDDGTPDPSFTPPTISATPPYSRLYAKPLVDPAGRILVAGWFEEINGKAALNVARLLPDGTMDESFKPGIPWSRLGGSVSAQTLQPDGKLLLAGDLPEPYQRLLLRLLPDGGMDPDFGAVTRKEANIWGVPSSLALLPDGSITMDAGGLRKFTAHGQLDPAFTASTPGFNGGARLLPDGRYLLPGNGGLTLYDAVGTPLQTLTNLASTGTSRAPTGFAALGGGDVVVAGQFTRADAAAQPVLARFAGGTGGLATHQPDLLAWHGSGHASPDPLSWRQPSVIRLSDGGAAYFAMFHDEAAAQDLFARPFTVLGRLRPDGTRDPAWFVSDSRTNAWLTEADSMVPDTSGGLFLTCVSAQTAADGDGLVVRVRPDGRRDETFTPPAALTQGLTTFSYDPAQDDRAQAATGWLRLFPGREGRFIGVHVDTAGRQRVLKLGADLAPLSGFASPSLREMPPLGASLLLVRNPKTGESIRVRLTLFGGGDLFTTAELPDGRVLVGGTFTNLGGLPDTALLARLSTNGAVDAGFRPPVFGNTPGRLERPGVLALAVDAQQRIYVAGSFDLLDGRPARGLARLRPDGAVDAEFEPPIESITYPFAIEASLFLEGETLWVGGTFRALDEAFPRPVWKLSTVTGPRLTTPALAGGVFTAQATLAAGRSYRFQRTQDFAAWTDLATLPGDGTVVTLQDPAVPATHAGYRLVSP